MIPLSQQRLPPDVLAAALPRPDSTELRVVPAILAQVIASYLAALPVSAAVLTFDDAASAQLSSVEPHPYLGRVVRREKRAASFCACVFEA